MNKSELTELKKNFLKQYNIYCKRFLENHNSKDYLKKQTKLVDQILIKIWKSFSVDNISLVAVGGYGRKELFPYSDVDILIIFEKEISKDEQDSISQFVTNCWDLGLKIGHSVRNIKETKYEFKKDITTATNLIESRFLVGSISVFNKLKHAITTSLSIKKFYKLKLEEQANRHRKFKDSAYQLEPNIKESPGGLRDLQMILWVATSQKKGKTFEELAQKGILSDDQYRKIRLTISKVNRYRILLHILSKSTDDRLTFDVQARLSKALGYQAKKGKKSSEILMKNFYKSVNYIILLNEILLKKLDPNDFKITQIFKYPFF